MYRADPSGWDRAALSRVLRDPTRTDQPRPPMSVISARAREDESRHANTTRTRRNAAGPIRTGRTIHRAHGRFRSIARQGPVRTSTAWQQDVHDGQRCRPHQARRVRDFKAAPGRPEWLHSVQDEGRTRARGNTPAAHEAVPAERRFVWPSDLYGVSRTYPE
jgi:hypothetical protein